MDSIAFAPVAQRPRFPSDSELAARAWEPGPADTLRHANKAQTDATLLAAKLAALLHRYAPGDFDADCQQRAAHDARRYKLPGPMLSPQGWVEFSNPAGSRVLGVR